MLVLIIEIIFYIIFLLFIFRILKSGKTEEIFFFVLPIFLFYFFIEFMSLNNQKYLFSDEFLIKILNVPLVVLCLWVIFIYLSFSLSSRISRYYKLNLSIYKSSMIDGLIAVIISLILEPLAVRLGFWTFLKNPIYFGIPLWNFIGRFLSVFILSFGYRRFKNLFLKKRMLFTYSYISLILLARFFVYKFS